MVKIDSILNDKFGLNGTVLGVDDDPNCGALACYEKESSRIEKMKHTLIVRPEAEAEIVEASKIIVIAVFHSKRSPKSWQSRIN